MNGRGGMKKIRVLVVDDAVVVRRLLSNALSAVPDIEVAGVAANGLIALQKIPQCAPDVVTLDIEMPELDGLETLKRIRVEYPTLPVIMFQHTDRAGSVGDARRTVIRRVRLCDEARERGKGGAVARTRAG